MNLVDNDEQAKAQANAVALNAKAKEFGEELETLAEKYGLQMLVAASFKAEDATGVFFGGKPNVITEMGLAKVIENKFSQY